VTYMVKPVDDINQQDKAHTCHFSSMACLLRRADRMESNIHPEGGCSCCAIGGTDGCMLLAQQQLRLHCARH